MYSKVLMFQPIYHVSVSPTDGNGPTQGQRKTLTRVDVLQELHIVVLVMMSPEQLTRYQISTFVK